MMKKIVAGVLCAGAGLAAAYSPEDATREARFADPPASARILPIIHGRPDKLEQVKALLDSWEDGGFGGVTANVSFKDYLDSPAAWETFRALVRDLRARGQALWLYDEKGYPSCTAGGKTLEGHPEWRARAYLVAVTNVPTGSAALPPSPPGKPVATLRRASADGKTETVYVVTDDYIREGTHVSVSVSTYKYDYPNLLMREPTARFIALTHDAYKRELGEDLKYVTSTFTDEPSLMTYWMRAMPYLCLPVSDELLAAYAARAGHPLAEDVPELVHGAAKGRVAAARHRYWSMVGARVSENYIGQLTDWCDANGILSGGHLLAEESLVAHTALYGDFFRTLRRLSAPSVDMLQSVPARVTWLTGLLGGSAGELNGARRVMSESSDHCQRYRKKGVTTPVYQVTDREIVGTLNRQIWGGVNTFTSYYNWTPFTRAQRRAINEEIGRTVTLMSEGRTAADIALLYPADTLMTGFEPKHRNGGGEQAARTAGFVNAAGASLFRANRTFMFVDAESIEKAEVRGDTLALGPLAWRTVVLPGVTTLPRAAARKLAAFARAGGLVIALGDAPCNSTEAFPDAEVARCAAAFTLLDDGVSNMFADFLAARHRPALARTRGAEDALRTAHRHTAAGDVFFVMNDTGAAWSGAVRVAGDPETRVWNPRAGLSTCARGEIPLDLPPFGGVVLTTDVRVEGARVPGNAKFELKHKTPAAAPTHVTLGKARDVTGAQTDLGDGWRRVEATVTKSNVDTFAFLARAYAAGTFPETARGLSFTVRVPATTAGSPMTGVFVHTRDGTRWFAPGHRSLAEAGTNRVTLAFGAFAPHGASRSADCPPTRLDPAEIVSVNIGFGGYFGAEGERFVFDISAPGWFEL